MTFNRRSVVCTASVGGLGCRSMHTEALRSAGGLEVQALVNRGQRRRQAGRRAGGRQNFRLGAYEVEVESRSENKCGLRGKNTVVPIKWTRLCIDVLAVQKLDVVQRTYTHVTLQAVRSRSFFYSLPLLAICSKLLSVLLNNSDSGHVWTRSGQIVSTVKTFVIW